MTGPDPTAALWRAVGRMTRPTRVLLARAPDRDAADQLAASVDQLAAGVEGVCKIAAYRAAIAAYRAATTTHTNIPSLWEQAVDALTGGEVGGSGSKPLQQRTPADLDLMEVMSLIRGTTRHELTERDHDPMPASLPGQIRRLASVVLRDDPDQIWWFTYRIDQWGRLLETYLHAAEHQPKPTRLRNSACPNCGTRQVVVEGEDGAVVAPALLVDYRDGYVRAAVCSACAATWWRGPELEGLARVIDTPGIARSAKSA